MTYSGLTTEHRPTSEQSARTAPLSILVLHHAATTNVDQVVAMMMPGGRQVSAHIALKDARIVGVVDEGLRAWSLSSAKYDSMALTVEACNSSIGGAWPLSPETHESLAKLSADWSTRYGIPLDRAHVMGHREVYTRYGASYATACPGGMDLDWIVNRARELKGLGPAPAPITSAPAGIAAPATYNGYAIATIQARLTTAGFPTTADGIYGPDTKAKVRAFQSARGLVVDGIVGAATWAALAGVPAAAAGGLMADGVWGPATTRALQRVLGVSADGVLGPQTYRALQSRTGAGVDGIVGPNTRKALQRHLGVAQDGIWGPATARALQNRLNSGTF